MIMGIIALELRVHDRRSTCIYPGNYMHLGSVECI